MQDISKQVLAHHSFANNLNQEIKIDFTKDLKESSISIVLIYISPLNIFPIMPGRFHQNCWAFLATMSVNGLNLYIIRCVLFKDMDVLKMSWKNLLSN